MTATVPSEANVYVATEDDLRRALADALDYAGYTYAQLAEQAHGDDFATPRARMAWASIGDLGYLVE